MTITIYDWDNEPTEVSLPEGVTKLTVQVVSGDEIIYYTDPETKQIVQVDSSSNRRQNFYDGEYDVTDISAWDEYGKNAYGEPEVHETISYARMYSDWEKGGN